MIIVCRFLFCCVDVDVVIGGVFVLLLWFVAALILLWFCFLCADVAVDICCGYFCFVMAAFLFVLPFMFFWFG